MTNARMPDTAPTNLNQPPVWEGVNAYLSDPLLVDETASMARTVRDEFEAIGRYVTSPEARELARMADIGAPVLRTHGPAGERLDVVDFHPSWHALMRRVMTYGLHSSAWENLAAERGQAHKARAVRYFLMAQLETGHLGPASTTSAAVAAMIAAPAVSKDWAPKILSRNYDSANRAWTRKSAATIGLGVSEKQAGTDMPAMGTVAERVGDGIHRLSGHKWFLSAPMSDAFIMLAATREGIGCFLVPRLLENGEANGLRFQRLKHKIGQKSNATAEVEFSETFGFLLGTPDAGQRTILDMLTLGRLDAALAACGLMRASLAEAVHHARHRHVSGRRLIGEPIMTRVLSDMALDVAAASALALRLADAFDRARDSVEDAAYARIMTPVAKYWCCKLAPTLISEAMECIGGNGYVEERPIARHFRDAPALSLGEGPGNVMALDLMRIVARGKDLFEPLFDILSRDLGPAARRTVDVLRAAMSLCERDEGAARLFIEQLALAGAAAELYRLGAGRVADAFVETRLAGGWRSSYGMLDSRFDSAYLLDLLYPAAI